ncbi:TetR/AcrR family transcriptional regulator [Nocardia goodfellowii]|uniref:AcrR family transcriptional regulator n=1 Tax=Nocardia goodfellowii TaxID=882446 RepID=A0ABS4QNE2_9NOCA|nr:TetR/AcrR family transcriptional regulator [Nocardia goodfellowii]MBP2193229.1 AcrR family transcriptional regulator [Nocardia goodfellowii]
MSGKGAPVRGVGAAHDERRQSILEAVFTIVDTEGVEGVSIRNVAQQAGVSIGRVQHYFPTKEDLLAAAFTSITEVGGNRVREQVAIAGTDDPIAVLRAILAETIPRTAADRRLFRIMQAFETHALPRPNLAIQMTEGYSGLIDLIALLLGRTVTTDLDVVEAARELLALSTGLAGLTLTGNITADQARHIVFARLDSFVSGCQVSG